MIVYRIIGVILLVLGSGLMVYDYCNIYLMDKFEGTVLYYNLIFVEKIGFGKYAGLASLIIWFLPVVVGFLCIFSPDPYEYFSRKK